jgi:hypothetical protein
MASSKACLLLFISFWELGHGDVVFVPNPGADATEEECTHAWRLCTPRFSSLIFAVLEKNFWVKSGR